MNKNKCRNILCALIMVLGLAVSSLGQEVSQNDENIFVESLKEARKKRLKVALIDIVDVSDSIPVYKAKLDQIKDEFEPNLIELKNIANEMNSLEKAVKLLEKDTTEFQEKNGQLKSIIKLHTQKRKDLEEQILIRKQELLGDIREKVLFHLKKYLKAHKYDAVYDISFTRFMCVEHNFSKFPFITDAFIKYFNYINP